MTSLLNSVIGEYRIVELLGAGGMGEVYKAVHLHLHRVIAIKVLSPELADPASLSRFYEEAGILARVHHPGVAGYLGFYEFQGRPCILMEYVDGETLAARLRQEGPLAVAEAVRVMRELTAAVASFHARGVVHRDLKSHNVKIDSGGRVKILDFGIARQESSRRLTRVGSVIGTLEVLAPEQIRGDPVTAAVDVWQLGVMFYELLTARLPFTGDTTMEICAHIVAGECPSPSTLRLGVPGSLERIVARCLERDTARRYASAAELHKALCHWEAGVERWWERLQQPGARPWIAGAAAASLVIFWLLLVSLPIGAGRVSLPRSADPPAPLMVPNTATKRVTVDTMDGVAEVYRNGQRAGLTPFVVQGSSGERVSLILRREGCRDLPVEFELSERRSYTYTLEHQGRGR